MVNPENQFHTTELNDLIIVTLRGDIDLFNIPHIFTQTENLIKRGEDNIVFDLKEIGYMDSELIKFLIRIRNLLEDIGGEISIVVATTQHNIHRILNVSGLDRFIDIHYDNHPTLLPQSA